jgi:hypothetical protein
MGDIILENIPEKSIDRFFTKFEKLGPDACWEWQGQKDKDGYGKFSYRVKPKRYFERAHRISAGIYLGDVVGDAIVMHKCDNPSCVNPNHLKIGTHLENEQDKDRKGRRPMDHIRKYTDEQIRKVFCMVRDGYFTKDIHDKVNIPKGVIQCIYGSRKESSRYYKIARNIFLSFSPEEQTLINYNIENKGERSTSAKINEKDVLEIRAAFLLGKTAYEISKKYPVNSSHIDRICKKQRWKHLKDPDCIRQAVCETYLLSSGCQKECNGYIY